VKLNELELWGGEHTVKMVRSVGRQSESAKGVETLIEEVEKYPERDPCECERVRSEIEYFEVVRRETIV
jgi:hypothetical protein